MKNKLDKLIEEIDSLNAYNPEKGLPDSVFYFIGRNTPYINVDLLIKTNLGAILTWRDDVHTGNGWHVPGGIIRYKESITTRINYVALKEVGIKIKSYKFLDINQIIVKNKKERAHFISLLYECSIDEFNLKKVSSISNDAPNLVNFFRSPPQNLLKYHSIYKDYLNDH